MWVYISMFVLMIVGLLLIFIILLQRGRGGGLAGALGGMGGQSALGTKAGDLFTRITVVLAVIWMLTAVINVWAMSSKAKRFQGAGDNETIIKAPANDPDTKAANEAGDDKIDAANLDIPKAPAEGAAKETDAAPPKTPESTPPEKAAEGTPPTTEKPAEPAKPEDGKTPEPEKKPDDDKKPADEVKPATPETPAKPE